MISKSTKVAVGRVMSLHLHPSAPGEPMHDTEQFEVVADRGILEDPRYFARVSRSTGQPAKRQISLIEREQIAEHAAALERREIPPGAVRSNIETSGIRLVDFIGAEVRAGEAVLRIHSLRTPCPKMDAVYPGLQQRMSDGRQGVLAEVVQSGRIAVGDTIEIVGNPTPA